MRTAIAHVLITALAAGCAGAPGREAERASSTAVVASRYEPAAQFEGSGASYAEGAVLGAAGGAGVGAMSAKASAGLLCTIGGPLCLIVVIPAAIVGGLVGGLAGAAADAITSDPGGRIADAQGTIQQAVAEMRLSDALAARTAEAARLPLNAAAELTLEVGVSDLEILAREKEMALLLRGRTRLTRSASGELVEERFAEARTPFRRYQDWAADEAKPLREAVDVALAQLSQSLNPK